MVNSYPPPGKSPFVIGIDLGTTNCAVAYVNIVSREEDGIQIFHPLQLVCEGNLSPLPLLPSYLYLAGHHELFQGNISLPWDTEITYVVGEFGKKLGAQVPTRLVSSVKSWLCHAGADRKAAILPWGTGRGLEKLSPIEASSRYLQHIRDAWNYQMAQGKPEYLLQNQDIILTVPASFDEVARELTLEAAQKAGLERITLLEEPQAAFYCWIATHNDIWHQYLHNGQIVLICDMGGGTTDFSLITVQEERGRQLFTRVAVGDHLILGGDNIDMALARHIEVKLMGQSGKLNLSQWATLSHSCRMAKEELLTEGNERDRWPIVVQDRSSQLIGSTLKFELTKEEMIEIIEEGFFPIIRIEEDPAKTSRMGLQEWGLPYTQDTAITRHLSVFLRKHQVSIRDVCKKTRKSILGFIMPDAVLFNGGALKPPFLQNRITQALENWFSSTGTSSEGERWSPLVLSNNMSDLAVAFGAAYYGLVRRGKGVYISGGIGRSYYIGIGVGEQKGSAPQALCVVPRKMEEGQEVEIKDKELILLIGEPVSFPLYTSSTRLLDQAGDILLIDEETFDPLPPIQTILRRGRAKLKEIPVHLRACSTEIGTIELWCVSRQGDRQWRLQFGIREEGKQKPLSSEMVDQNVVTEGEALNTESVRPLFSLVFSERHKDFPPEFEKVAIENLSKKMEEALNAKRQIWPIFTLRKISEMLLEFSNQKKRSALYEARWLNLVGFCLRPGFGYPLDEWRIKKVWKIFQQGMTFPKDRETRTQWWILWRRVAGGLNQNQQREIFRKIVPYLIPQKKVPPGPKPSSHELAEMWRLAASLERLKNDSKEKMGSILLDRLSHGKFSFTDLWALARLGARQPLYGSVHTVVPVNVAEEWIAQLLTIEKLPRNEKNFTLSQLTRNTSDRARNVREEIRQRVIEFFSLEKEKILSGPHCESELASLDRGIQNIQKVSYYLFREQNLIFGESLPKGLKLLDVSSVIIKY